MLTPRPATAPLPDTRLARLGASCARHPWRFIVAWVIVSAAALTIAVAGVGAGSLFSRLSTGEPGVPGEAHDASVLLDAAEGGPTRLLQLRGVDLADPAVVSALTGATQGLAGLPGVTSVTSPLTVPGGPNSAAAAPFVTAGSPQGSADLLTIVALDPGLTDAAKTTADAAVAAGFDRVGAAAPGASATSGSVDDLVSTITTQVEQDLRLGEGIALPLSFAIMVVVFGGFVAAGMPTLGALASILGALAALYGISFLIDLDVSVVNVVTLLGLGLSIDYGLLIVSRFREELRAIVASPGSAGGTRASRSRRGITREQVIDASAHTMARAGRTILFSALTVAIALSGLLIFEAQIIRAIGAAGVSVVIVALLAALTLVPALCALGAKRLMRGHRELAPEDGLFSRLARLVQRRPVPVIVLTTAVLIGLSLPAFSMRLTSSGPEMLPKDNPVRVFFESLNRDFPFASGPEVSVAAQGPLAEVRTWAEGTVAALPGVLSTRTEQRTPQIVEVSVFVEGEAQDQASREVVASIRENRPAFQTSVTGPAARLADFTTSMASRAPFAGAVVAFGSLVLLFLLTGSLVIPVKALVLNVLSLGASLGVLVWVFQQGHLEWALGFTSNGAIESIMPLLVLAFGFGLSMDYEVFLISRIAEIYHGGGTTDDAVLHGLQRSGRIITSAALLIMIVFAGFIAGQLVVIKQTGLALTTAVLLDATLVRMLLVPATMTLLGEWSWWSPAPLRRWHEKHGLAE